MATHADHRKGRILDSVLEHIGWTPMIRLNRIGKAPSDGALACELLVKCEFFNAGGSVKDRIGKRMVEEAEVAGLITPGCHTLIEPTSGNTGIGLALAAAVKGYRAIITLPEKMSKEKVDVLKALGAEIIRTPTEAAWDAPDSHIGVAQRLHRELPHSYIPDQYTNPHNPLAHYEGTAEEILAQCGGHLDMFVGSVGTGGTLTGVARKLKERLPHIHIVGVDPHGSILAEPASMNPEGIHSYQVEGIGYDFVPKVLDRSLVDTWIKTRDRESFLMARRLIREEGLLCGGSCGATVVGALQAAKLLRPGQRCVILLADSTRNYMTKFLSDEWMQAYGYTGDAEHPTEQERSVERWGLATIADLKLQQAVCIPETAKLSEAIKLMQSRGFDQLPVTSAASPTKLVGLITLGNVLAMVAAGRANPNAPLDAAMFTFAKSTKYVEFTPDSPLSSLSKFFETHSSALVTRGGGVGAEVVHVVTKIDLLAYLVGEEEGAV